jgi:Flp pilus assembly protein TadD
MHSAKARIASDPYRELIEKKLPEIQAKRAEIILDVREAKKFAVQELPDEAMADTHTMPKTHPKGRTRGTRTLTRPRAN